jgi:hypothetical protein
LAALPTHSRLKKRTEQALARAKGPGDDHTGKLTDTAIQLQAEWIRPRDKRVVVAVTKLQLEKK